jgi:hypothetical protein
MTSRWVGPVTLAAVLMLAVLLAGQVEMAPSALRESPLARHLSALASCVLPAAAMVPPATPASSPDTDGLTCEAPISHDPRANVMTAC